MKDAFPGLCFKLLAIVILVAAVCACDKAPLPFSPERCTGDSYGELHSPMVKDEDTERHRTRWSCLYFGTHCGPDTRDLVFILSEAEVFASEKAVDYGFYPGDGFGDPARQFRSTLYAYLQPGHVGIL